MNSPSATSNGWPVRPGMRAALRSEWNHLASPGASFTGAERLALARCARTVQTTGLLGPIDEVVSRIAHAPSKIDRPWLETILSEGLSTEAYVEIVGVVARLAAVDGFDRALGLPMRRLPEARPGSPTGEVDSAARTGKGFVPMPRGTSIWWALGLVPDEAERMAHLHDELYLPADEMRRMKSERAISRPQMELVATRTSVLNECFY